MDRETSESNMQDGRNTSYSSEQFLWATKEVKPTAYASNMKKPTVKIDVRLHFHTSFCPCKKISRPLQHYSHYDVLLIRLEQMQFLVSHQSVVLRTDFISERIHNVQGLLLLRGVLIVDKALYGDFLIAMFLYLWFSHLFC